MTAKIMVRKSLIYDLNMLCTRVMPFFGPDPELKATRSSEGAKIRLHGLKLV